jgi:hypothetical protein
MTKVHIAIKSCHKYAERRAAQLDTWLGDCEVEYFFLVGESAQPRRPSFDCGRIHCPSSDDFANIAPKVWYACRQALQARVTNLFVCDDDSYVVPARLLSTDFAKHDYIGFVRSHCTPPYMQGSSFWLSERAMHFIVAQPEKMGIGIPDDVAVGRCLYGNVPFVHEHRFAVADPYPQQDKWPAQRNDIISCHKCLPDVMHKVHEHWQASQK